MSDSGWTPTPDPAPGTGPSGPPPDDRDQTTIAPRAALAEAVGPAAGVIPQSGAPAAVGSIPYATRTRSWGRHQLGNWRLHLMRFLATGLAVLITVALTPGLRFTEWRPGELIVVTVVFGVLNLVLKPLLQFLSLRFIFSTYGLVVIVINTLLMVLLVQLMPDTFQAIRPVALVFAGALIGVIGTLLDTLLGVSQPILDRDYRERNGLA